MFGMNMNNVAVTDGDRVEFEQRMGYHVDYYPVSSLVEYLKKVTDAEADALVEEYKRQAAIQAATYVHAQFFTLNDWRKHVVNFCLTAV